MKIDDKVKIKGCERDFIVEIWLDGWVLLKKQVGDTFKIVDWYHQQDLEIN